MPQSLRTLLPCALLIASCTSENNSVQSTAMTESETAAPMMPRSAAPASARLYFVAPSDGDITSSPVHIEFGLDGMTVVPAGTDKPASGHHHIIIDAELPPFDQPVPADANHIHFGDGRTSTMLELAPGTHTLQLLLGDHLHIPHQPPVISEPISITIE